MGGQKTYLSNYGGTMKSTFEKLRELETDDLWFPEMEHGTWDLRIEATSYLKEDDIDVRIREKLSGIYVLENMRCESSQDPPPTCFGGPWSEAETEYWQKVTRVTYYTFLYDIAKVKPVDTFEITPSKTIKGTFYKDGHAVETSESCPECKGTGYYTPFVGPRETCKTCNGTKMVAIGEPVVHRPDTDDDLKDDFGQYVSQMLEPIDLGICKTSPYTDFFTHEERGLKFCITETDMWRTTKWDGNEFGRHFCGAVKVDILRLTPLANTKEVKLHFDFSTLRIEHNLTIRSYEMFIVYHMRIVQ